MPNINKGSNSKPFSQADMQFEILLGLGASTEVSVITVLGPVVAGNTLAIDVDGVTVPAVFDTNKTQTIVNLASVIQLESSVITAVASGNQITVTAAAVDTPVRLKNGKVTGGVVLAIVSVQVTTFSSSAGALNEIETIAYAPAGVSKTDRAWQIKKLIYDASANILGTNFANEAGNIPRSGYQFAFSAVPQVQELLFSRGETLLTGNTISVDVDGVAITQVFTTDHDTTLDALAVKIASESNVATAVRRGNYIIEVTSATSGLPVLLNNFSVTGGSEMTKIEVRETKAGQASAALLQFGE